MTTLVSRSNFKIKVRRKSFTKSHPYCNESESSENCPPLDKGSLKAHLPVRKSNPFTTSGKRPGPLKPINAQVNLGSEGREARILPTSILSLVDDCTFRAEHQGGETERERNVLVKILNSAVAEKLYTENSKKVVNDDDAYGDSSVGSDGPIFDRIPTDWSVKSRIRITSAKPFTFIGKVTTVEESKTIADFSRCTKRDSVAEDDAHVFNDFRRNLFSWMHPELPIWFDPHFSGERRVLMENPTIEQLLQSSWVNSFRSLFWLTKTGFCPFFYILGNTFSCLFSTTYSDTTNILCIVTPTTAGFRSLLTREGIDFAMPFSKKMENSSKKSHGSSSVVENEDSDDEFLESIGLSKSHFPSVKEKKIQHKRSKLLYIDKNEESTIAITNDNTVNFYNFVMNSSSFLDPVNSCTKEVPVLLAPIAFEGATLKCSKMSHGPTQCVQNGVTRKMFALDIHGYVLPPQFHNICAVLKKNSQDFHLFATVQASTKAFNVTMDPSSDVQTKRTESQNLGLSESEIDYLLHPVLHTAQHIEAVKCIHGSVHCSFK